MFPLKWTNCWKIKRSRARDAWTSILERERVVGSRGHLAVVTHGMLYRVLFSQHIFVDRKSYEEHAKNKLGIPPA